MYTQRSVQVRTKNPTSRPLRRAIFVPFLAVARLGSRTPTNEVFPNARNQKVYECNSVEGIENSRDKLRMKACFEKYDVPQADHYYNQFDPTTIKRRFGISASEGFALVGKAICGFQGNGMTLIRTDAELDKFCRTHSPIAFFIERFHNYGKEYRLHATRNKVFLVWRKLRRSDAQEKWFFNSHNCNWVGENHELFDKPSSWIDMCACACNAVASTGLDIGAVDIRVSSTNPNEFIVCEVNSAPALGEDGVEAYKREIKNVLMEKYLKDAK